jgi:hypothetical protein
VRIRLLSAFNSSVNLEYLIYVLVWGLLTDTGSYAWLSLRFCTNLKASASYCAYI